MAQTNNVAFCCESIDGNEQAAHPAQRLELPQANADCSDYPLLLTWTGDRLELRRTDKTCGPIYCDFNSGPFGHRSRQNLRGELLAKAVGFKGKPLDVVDATAGLGRDAALLALLGCRVTAIERHPVIHALLEDGLLRATDHARAGDRLQSHLCLVHDDSIAHLQSLRGEAASDVVCLDPMFPPRNKSAKVKKELQILGLLLGDADNGDELLAAAAQTGCRRIVVKRSLHAPPLNHPANRAPSCVFKGKAVRFDVYLSAWPDVRGDA